MFTPSGNWSSYPPHKHDTDRPPGEVKLEEIYYYRFADPDAYGVQAALCDAATERTLTVRHGDVVLIRRGYHPFVTAYGYDAYFYLNVLAVRVGRWRPATIRGTRVPPVAAARPANAGRRRRRPIASGSMKVLPARIRHDVSWCLDGVSDPARGCGTRIRGLLIQGAFPMGRFRTVGMLVMLMLGMATAASAQVDRATLTGIVRDPSGAIIAGGQVKVTSLATNAVVTATTTADGTYLVINLAPGEYSSSRGAGLPELRADRVARNRRAIAVGRLAGPGQHRRDSDVEGDAARQHRERRAWDRGPQRRGRAAARDQELGRSAGAGAGVQSDRYTEQAGGTASGRTGGVNVHGNRSLQNNFLLDGVANNS